MPVNRSHDVPEAPGQSSTPDKPRIRGKKDCFTWLVSPWEMGCVDGHMVPILISMSHWRPKRDPGGVKAVARSVKRHTRKEIPHDIVVTAFGEKREDYAKALEGSAGPYWVDAWTKVSILNGRAVIRKDEDGFKEFQRIQALDLVTNDKGELEPEQISYCLDPYFKRIKAYEKQSTPAADTEIRNLLEQMPSEHIPQNLKDKYFTKPAAESAAPKPRGRRSK